MYVAISHCFSLHALLNAVIHIRIRQCLSQLDNGLCDFPLPGTGDGASWTRVAHRLCAVGAATVSGLQASQYVLP